MPLSRAAVAAALLLSAGTVAADDYWVFIGTYTDGKNPSKGIYRAKLNGENGRLGDLQLAAEVKSPSFLAVDWNNKFLYAVGETNAKDGKGGSVHAYRLDAKTGTLTKLNDERTGGDGPCHISVNRTGKYAIAANYGGGSTALFKLKDDGSFDSQCDFIQHKGSSVNKSRQEAPHAHCAKFVTDDSSDAEFAYVVDLGLDQVLMYKLDADKGKLVPLNPAFVKVPEGSGPRHIAFSPNSGKAYVCGELNSTIITLRRDRSTGVLETWKGEGAVLSTLPAGADAKKLNNSTAEIVVHPKFTHVFVSNRGHNSIATFKIFVEKTEAGPHLEGTDGREIKTPRNFNIDPSGKWILVASQDGGTVRVIEWSDSQGNGKITDEKVEVSRPVCVKFVPVAK